MYTTEQWDAREVQVRKDQHEFRMLVVGRCVYAALIIPFCIHWLTCEAEPIYLMPVEFTTHELSLHRRHWFWPQTIEHLEARRNDDGKLEWMKQSEKGEWYPAFAPSEESASGGGPDY